MRAYLLWKNPEDACIEVYVVIHPSSPLEILVLFPLSLSLSFSPLIFFLLREENECTNTSHGNNCRCDGKHGRTATNHL